MEDLRLDNMKIVHMAHRRVCLEEPRIIYQIWFMNMVKEFIHINQTIRMPFDVSSC